jgi:hypothetical protein
VSPVLERLTGDWDFNYQSGRAMVDRAGHRGRRRRGGVRRLSAARRLRLATDAAAANNIVPFNPKHIKLEVFGDPGAVATINYMDINVQPRQVLDASLPWSLTMVTTQPGAFTNVVAQGNSHSLGCRIIVDDEVKDERIVNAVNAYTYCLSKSA